MKEANLQSFLFGMIGSLTAGILLMWLEKRMSENQTPDTLSKSINRRS